MLKRVFLIISLLLLAYLGYEFWDTYMATHTYYTKMLASDSNWKIIISGLLFSLLPGLYLIYAKKTKLITLISLFFLGLILFGFVFTTTKGGVGGFIKLMINSGILFGLAIFMFCALTSVGDVLKRKFLNLRTESIFDVLLSLGLGLSVFLLLNYILINFNVFYPLVSWGQVLIAGVLMRLDRESLKDLTAIVSDTLNMRGLNKWERWGLLFLVTITCLYIYLGFYLSDIAYSTAWDANHAYMFYPKMRALNNGYYWNEIGMATGFQLWYAFIAFWFSLFTPTGGILGISVDTMGISLNFWSGVFVLIFGLGLISELIGYMKSRFKKSSDGSFRIFGLGRLLLMLWLSSGMGAFLLFIDNKTDLGVMALIIIALYSGLVALRSIALDQGSKKSDIRLKNLKKEAALQTETTGKRGLTGLQTRLLALSGFFYAMAAMAKPTAIFDVINFALFTRWVWIGPLGTLGVLLGIIGLMSYIKFRGIEGYISPSVGKIIAGVGFLGLLVDLFRGFMGKSVQYIKYIFIRGSSFLLVYILFKLPFHAARAALYNLESTPSEFIQRMLFSETGSDGLTASTSLPLYAQLGASSGAACNLQSQGFTNTQQLYDALQESPGSTYDEDVGRYVGFGWKGNDTDARKNIKPFINPWWASLMSRGCHSVSPFSSKQNVATLLCEQEEARRNFDPQVLQNILGLADPESDIANSLTTLLDANDGVTSAAELANTYGSTLNEVQNYMQSNSIKVVGQGASKQVYFPYKYLTPFNISFNRSLQNLSSYYTDIGMIRLLLIFFSVIGLIYGIVSKNRILSGLQVVTLFGRLLWFYIGGGILRYAIGIIIWSIMSFVAFVLDLTHDEDNSVLGWVFIGCFALLGIAQLTLNFVRIASQGGSGAFMWYKSNVGVENQFNERLEQVRVTNNSFGKDDVFNLQFPHYNKFIQGMNTTSSDEGALIAGTYARYFVEDQTNINYDQFLTWLREMQSDGDICNTYLRLKDQNKKYIVIDPNIGTVVQGSGNQSLFDRFFGRLDTSKGTIVEDGVMTTLARMVEAGYLSYYSSNNIGAKYAYMLPNSSFGSIDNDKRILERARLSVPRFWGSQILTNIAQIAQQRIDDGSFIEDIADMFGKNIRVDAIRNIISGGQLDPAQIAALTQDERYVLVQYLNIRGLKQNNPDSFATELDKVLKRSIQSGSQIIVLEVK